MRGLDLRAELSARLLTMGISLVALVTWTPRSLGSAAPREARTDVRGLAKAAFARPKGKLSPGSAERTIVLVAVDGVRWQEVFGGVDARLASTHGLGDGELEDAAHLLPHLHRLMTTYGAAIGAPGDGSASPMVASGPNFVSLPGYMEIFTGRTDSGCTNNDCPRVPFPTVAEEMASAGLGPSVAVTSWESIDLATAATPSTVVVSAGRHRGSGREAFLGLPEVGALVQAAEQASPYPGNRDFRPDAYTSTIALAMLEEVAPGFLFVGLGDTDEYAHRNDYRGYLDALRAADGAIGGLADVVFRLNAKGHPTTLLITTDHGRQRDFVNHGKRYPESSRVWLVAAGAGIEARGRVPSHAIRTLSDVAPTIRRIVGLPPLDVPRAGEALTELLAPSSVATR